jgi:hypothetical protein
MKRKKRDFLYILSVSMIDVSYSKQILIGKYFGIFYIQLVYVRWLEIAIYILEKGWSHINFREI